LHEKDSASGLARLIKTGTRPARAELSQAIAIGVKAYGRKGCELIRADRHLTECRQVRNAAGIMQAKSTPKKPADKRQSPEFRARHSDAARDYWARLKADPAAYARRRRKAKAGGKARALSLSPRQRSRIAAAGGRAKNQAHPAKPAD
jgi:hypothetical protein